MDAGNPGKSKPVLAWFLERRKDRDVAEGNLLTKAYIFGFDALISPANAVVRSRTLASTPDEDEES